MSRPVKGYTVNRKIKSAKKCLAHAKENKNEDRAKFWEEYITQLQATQVKAKK